MDDSVQIMGVCCSTFSKDKVTEISIPSQNRTTNQAFHQDDQNAAFNTEVNLHMNFAPSLPHDASPSSIESFSKLRLNKSSNVEDKITMKTKLIINEKESPGKNSSVMSGSKQLVDDPPSLSQLHQEAVQQRPATGPAQSDLEITRKVGEILDKLISPESSMVDCTRVGRQSRLMHADINTVVSYDAVGIGGQKIPKKKVKPTLIKVKPYQEINKPPTPESPPNFNVCKHGIPLVDNLDDEEGGCIKCQRPNSRGGRELQGYLKFQRAERKKSRRFWAKNTETPEKSSRRKSQDIVEKALREFEEFHDKHGPT